MCRYFEDSLFSAEGISRLEHSQLR